MHPSPSPFRGAFPRQRVVVACCYRAPAIDRQHELTRDQQDFAGPSERSYDNGGRPMKQGIASSLAAAVLFAVFVTPTEARITRLQITTVESPTFGGRTFGASGEIGTYEKLVGRAYGEV